jgi:serine/threonine protein kinase
VDVSEQKSLDSYNIRKDTPVAVKKLKSVAGLEEFEREVSVLSSINHPNCVRLYGVTKSEDDNADMMVFEYLSAGNLSGLLQREGSTITTCDLLKM